MSVEPTVFVIDDDEMGRKSVHALVKSMALPCVTFSSAEGFLNECDSSRSGCVVVDIVMPGMSGLELQEQLAGNGFDLPVIVVSAYAHLSTAVKAMKQGAITILEKPCNNHELYNAIREALAIGEKNRAELAAKRKISAQLASLTPDEHQVMVQIVAGKSNKLIAHELAISVRTVESRRHNVFEKMGVGSVAELVRLVMQVDPEQFS